MMNKIVTAAMLTLTVGLFSAPAAAHDEGDAVVYRDCHEVLAWFKAPLENIRPHVPGSYGVPTDEDGVAAFYVSTRLCDRMTVAGVEVRNVVDSHLSVPINPPTEAPHRSFPPEIAEVYLVQWVTNRQPHATWMKQETGLGDKVKLVRDLAFDYNPEPGRVPGAVDETFALDVPSPATSPFHIDAEVHEPTGCSGAPTEHGFTCAVPEFVAVSWWADTDQDTTVIIHSEASDGATGSSEARVKGTITAYDPNSPLGQMFGGEQGNQHRPLCSDANGDPDPACAPGVRFGDEQLVGIDDPIGTSYFTEIQYTKCVRRTPADCTSH